MKRIIKKVKRRHVREIVVYGFVGGFSWLVQSAFFLGLIHVGIFPSVAMIIGNIAGMFTSYFGHVRFTFRKTHKFSHQEFIKFVVTAAIGLSINVIGVRIVTKVLYLNPHYAIIPTIFTPFITFLISKFWAFK